MTDDPTDDPRPHRTLPEAVAARIDELMAQPVKGRAKITVFGDEAVFGINPAPPRASEPQDRPAHRVPPRERRTRFYRKAKSPIKTRS